VALCRSARRREREGERDIARKTEREKESGEIGLVLVIGV